jgi:hypothetical protein
VFRVLQTRHMPLAKNLGQAQELGTGTGTGTSSRHIYWHLYILYLKKIKNGHKIKKIKEYL